MAQGTEPRWRTDVLLRRAIDGGESDEIDPDAFTALSRDAVALNRS